MVRTIALAAMLAAALTPFCAAQDVLEAAPMGSNAAAPLKTAPVQGGPLQGGALKTAPAEPEPFESAPLKAAPLGAAPIQALVTGADTMPATFSSISRIPAESNMLHVTVGHQFFINTKTRLRRIYVTDASVLSSVTLSPNQIVVTALAPGLTSMTLLDEIGRAQSYLVSSDLDIDGLRDAMGEALRSDAVKVEGSGGRVVLSGTVTSQAAVDNAVKLAGMYAKDVVDAITVNPGHPKQVRLEVRILEVDRSKALQLGINLFNPGGNTSFLAATTTAQYPSTSTLSGSSTTTALATVIASNPLNFMLYSAKLNLGTTIQDLQTKQVLQILAEPTITTISGQKADFLSGGEFPFPIAQPGSGGGAPVITISFRPYGVKVEFTPIVNDDGTIRLTVAPEVSALDYSNAVSISGFTVPALSTRRAETQVELRSNQSFAISGLLDQRTTDLLDKSPGISSVPILGALFKSKNVNHSTTELVVVVTPTVVDPLTDNSEPVQPDMPIPTLDQNSFDKSLGKNLNPRPAAPPLNPERPPFGDMAPMPLPPGTSPDGKVVGDAAPVQAPASTPVQSQPNISVQSPSIAVPTAVQVPASAAPSANNIPMQAPAVTPAVAPAQIPVSIPAQSQQQAPASAPVVPSASPATGAAPDTKTPATGTDKTPTSGPANASVQPASTNAATTSNGATSMVVEIMALSHESDADATLSALRRRGYNPAIKRGTEDSLLHLDLGPFPSRSDAEAVRQRLLQDGYDATIK